MNKNKTNLIVHTTITLILVFSSPAFAQETSRLGFKSGIAWSRLKTNSPANRDGKFGISLGIQYEKSILPKINVAIAVTYNQQGSIFKFEGLDENNQRTGENQAKSNLDYISFNLIGKLYLSNGQTKPFLSVASNVQYLLRQNLSFYDPSGHRYAKFTNEDGYKSFVGGIIIGAGMELSRYFAKAVFAELSYEVDITHARYDSDKYDVLFLQLGIFW